MLLFPALTQAFTIWLTFTWLFPDSCSEAQHSQFYHCGCFFAIYCSQESLHMGSLWLLVIFRLPLWSRALNYSKAWILHSLSSMYIMYNIIYVHMPNYSSHNRLLYQELVHVSTGTLFGSSISVGTIHTAASHPDNGIPNQRPNQTWCQWWLN